MEQVRLGLVGVGNIGTVHLNNLLAGKVPQLALVAVADRRPERRDFAKAKLPADVRIFEEGDALIDSGLCDAVLIAVPHYQHPPMAMRAFAAGLHVLLEKPAGVYTLQVRQMIDAADKNGKVFGAMFNQRTNSLYRKMRDMVQGGEMGAVKRVSWIITDWYRSQSYYDSGGWRATWAGEGGGVLLNQCPHNLDLLQWICGMPVRVRAFCHNGKWHDIEVEDDVTAYLEYPNGATGTFTTTTGDAPGTNRLEVTLEMGKLVCEDGKLTQWLLDENERVFCLTSKDGFKQPGCTVRQVETDGSNEQHVGVMKAFAAAVLRGEPLVADGREGINGLTLSNAMHLSSWLEQTVSLPLNEELFLAELDKRRASSHQKADSDVTLDAEGSY